MKFKHQVDPINGRFICDKDHPMPFIRPMKSFWSHPDAKLVDEDYGKGGGFADGDYELWECPHCKHTWKSELPN